MPTDPAEVERLKKVVAHVHANLLTLIDAQPKQPGHINGRDIQTLYQNHFDAPLDPEALTGQSDLKSMLNRRNIFPSIGVRGSEKKGGWLIYRVAATATAAAASSTADAPTPALLLKVQDNILALLEEAANPTEPGAIPHYSIDAGKLLEQYGPRFKSRFNFRDFGFSSLRALLESCPKLGVVMKSGGAVGRTSFAPWRKADAQGRSKPHDKMHVVARCPDGSLKRGTAPALKRSRDESSEQPPAVAAPSASAGVDDEEESAEAKAARKAAKRAKKAAAAGLTEAEFEAQRAVATANKKAKKEKGKEKKKAWKEGKA